MQGKAAYNRPKWSDPSPDPAQAGAVAPGCPLQIEVFLPNNQRRSGTLQHYSLHYNVALVSVEDYRAPRPASIQLQYFKCSKVAAVGRCFESGTLMAASGLLVDWTGTHDCKFLVHSSCKISKAGIGGPLVDFDGRVLDMNFYDKKIGTPFLLWNEISNILAYFLEKEKSRVSQAESTVAEARNDSEPSGVPFWKMAGDRSVRPNRWLVHGPYRRRRNNLGKDEDESESEDEDESESEDEGESEQSLRYTYKNGKRWLYC